MTNIAKQFRYKKAELGNFVVVSDVARRLVSGVRIMGFTDGSFSLIDIIKTVLDVTGPSCVTVCTWSAGIKDANQVKWLIDSKLIKSFTIITDHSYVTRQKRYSMELSHIFGDENIRTSEVHAKFTLISNDNWNICIRHSMNLNANKTCESFEIDDDKEIFEYHKNFINHTLLTMPEGFEGRSWVANDSLRSFFNEEKVSAMWSKTGKWE